MDTARSDQRPAARARKASYAVPEPGRAYDTPRGHTRVIAVGADGCVQWIAGGLYGMTVASEWRRQALTGKIKLIPLLPSYADGSFVLIRHGRFGSKVARVLSRHGSSVVLQVWSATSARWRGETTRKVRDVIGAAETNDPRVVAARGVQ